jgi:hypothetical protein
MDPSKGDRDVTLFRVIVSGKKEGIIVEIRWEMVDHFDEINGITAKHGEIEPPARRFRANRAL